MRKILKTVASYLLDRTIFKFLFVMTMLLITVPYINDKIRIISFLTCLHGFIIIGYELFNGKLKETLSTTKTVLLLGGFSAAYLFTILINKTNIINGFKGLFFMILLFVMFFLFPKDYTKEKVTKEIKLVSVEFISITFIYSLISLILYLFSISGKYVTSTSYEAYYGMHESRLWGIYNPNTSATLTVVSIVLSLAFIVISKRKRFIIPLILNVLLQFSVLLLTGSRAGLYVMAAATAFSVFMAFICLFKKFNFATASISFSCAVVSIVIFLAVGVLIKEGLAYLPSLTNTVVSLAVKEPENTQGNSSEKPTTIDKVDLNRIEGDELHEQSMFANRIDIWNACFAEFLEAPIFGVGRDNIFDRAIENLDDDKWNYHFKYGNTHNVYLCVLVSSGIIGFLLIGSFAVVTVSRSIKTIFKTYKKINILFLASFMICMMLYANEFVESRILYKVGIYGTVFWMYCGYMYKLSKIEIENSEQLMP